MTNPTAKHVAVQEGMEARRDGKTFKDFEEAIAARIEAEKRYQGKFASTQRTQGIKQSWACRSI